MQVLFVENNDSFSWNVIDRLPLDRSRISVVPGRDLPEVAAGLESAGAVVIGPGPLDPERAGLIEVVRAVLAKGIPLLGVCLGHQAIGLSFGARIVRTPPSHGYRSLATFRPSRLFPGFQGSVEVMRYHSLSLADVPPPLDVTAVTDDGLPMAIEHAILPVAGLQFHPDSFGTPRGEEMLAAFFRAVS